MDIHNCSIDVQHLSFSPYGLNEGCDLFLADPSSSRFLLLDGSPGTGASRGLNPRMQLFENVAPGWQAARLDDLHPQIAVEEMSKCLATANRSREHKMYASGVMCQFVRHLCVLAEAGDTKAFLASRGSAVPVFPDLLPSDGPVIGALGIGEPAIRTVELSMGRGEFIFIVTDGAYRLLASHNVIDESGHVENLASVVDVVERRATEADDDATLVLLRLPEVDDWSS